LSEVIIQKDDQPKVFIVGDGSRPLLTTMQETRRTEKHCMTEQQTELGPGITAARIMETETSFEKRSTVEAAPPTEPEPAPPRSMEIEPTFEEQGVTTTASRDPGVPPAAYSRTRNQAWEVRFSELKTWWYASDKGKNGDMPCDVRITRWVRKQRGFRVKGTLLPERVEMMNGLEDFEWTTITTQRNAPARSWKDSYEALVDYFKIHKHCNIQHNDSANIRLYQWSNLQRQSRNECNLSDERIALLDKLHFNWTHSNEDRWDSCYQQLVDYHNKYGHFRFYFYRPQPPNTGRQAQSQEPVDETAQTVDEVKLLRWATKQRAEAYKGTLRADRLAKLKDIGFFRGVDNQLLRQEGALGPGRLELQGKRKQHQEDAQQERKQAPVQASSASIPPAPKPPPPPSSSSSSSPNDRDDINKIKDIVVANVGTTALHSEYMLTLSSSSSTASAHSQLTGMQQVLSPQDEQLRLQLQFQQLQERRRRQREQHLLLLSLGQARLQMPFDDVRGGHEQEEDSNLGEQGQENDEDTSSWSRDDDDLLQELHQAQGRVDQLKTKLAKHMSQRHAQRAVAALVPKPRIAAQQRHNQNEGGTVLDHHHHQQRRQRHLEQQQKVLLVLQQQQQQQERAQQRQLVLRQEILQQQLRQQGQQQQTQHQPSSDSILLAAAATAARARNLESRTFR
jgi:hypothetical protein